MGMDAGESFCEGLTEDDQESLVFLEAIRDTFQVTRTKERMRFPKSQSMRSGINSSFDPICQIPASIVTILQTS